MVDSPSLPAFPLDPDLMDCLLTTLRDFESLQAFISSSKFIYSIFRCRQNSILGAVAHSQFGLALPQAMRLIKYLDRNHSSGLAHELQCEANSQDFTITPAQARLLRNHAAIVRALEDIYSWREKDPRFKSSQLSAAESLRFQKSVYRFWLLAAMYGPGAVVDERLGDRGGNHLELKDSIVTKQITFLLSFGEVELLGIDEVHGFFLDLAEWALMKHTTSPTRFSDRNDIFLVWSGPAVILDAFRGKWPSFCLVDSQWYGTWRAMTYAFFASEIGSITGGRVLSTIRQRFILDDHFLENVECSRCEGLPSLSRAGSLWSLCNWEYMILAITPSRLGSFLSFEKRRPLEMLISFTEAIESIPYPQFIEEIFDVRSEGYKDWKKEDWLCTHCMTKMLSGNIQTWFDERATGAGASRDPSMSHVVPSG
ncbi:hypothetical protein L210DRAFT_3153298 [Boletus edulis BED1]|uniref:Uncharacterized protein n=1 Tax=Boletus edulis BED1 TaxID=1328754 RepID=A0AAD4BXP8_BOLED|nr:hypothetical protein L210DRAFT_3153298 [Boletus edulis BED1]